MVRLLLCLLLISNTAVAQIALPTYNDSLFSTYYHQRTSLFRSLPQTKHDIIFVGNSITDGNEWSEWFGNSRLKNRGISGDISAGVIHRIHEIANRKPEKVFLMIGVNDLARKIKPDSIVKNILLITDYLRQQSPATSLYIQSILPVSDAYNMFALHTNKGKEIKQINAQLRDSARNYRYSFIDLYSFFSGVQEKLKKEYSNDGLHLTGDGYLLWKHLMFGYVNDLARKPALIPEPQFIEWKNTVFPLAKCKSIVIANPELQKEAEQLKAFLQSKGIAVAITKQSTAGEPYIAMSIADVTSPQNANEGYELEVDSNQVSLRANTLHGIFNGLQTLKQLMRDMVMIDACHIKDWPAFSWRGYMIDVGRNYMPVDLLKEQIDVMSRYKLNVVHFHPTEDIAWRIAIKQYPQLTAPEYMLRKKGMYYTESEIKELIQYCKERYIAFVPEIDMPGHSAAFKRAMKTDMQSDSGIIIVKNILKEFCETYDVPYIHIGADEVKITNKDFIPEMTELLVSMGKKVIGWQPGGNFSNHTIRQLWMEEKGHHEKNQTIQYIDSRHLYLNHIDPLETPVTIFYRKIGDKEKGDNSMLGGTLCMWQDRAVASWNDILGMNAVYPGMLAFAERCWKGGGVDGWTAVIDEKNRNLNYAQFENRLLDHKQQSFPNKPFPYVRQSYMKWDFYGPYDNSGDIKQQFAPELSTFDTSKTRALFSGIGGTVVLRHWWAPMIKGMLDSAKENTTWYAQTKVWSPVDRVQSFWIGFNNLSRSMATDSPPAGAWDNKGSAVWVNGNLIPPPQWIRGGQKGNLEIPLIDEGYAYRAPTKIFLKQGWNDVLIKVPVGSFKGKDWQNPVKWMFTFVQVPSD